MKSAAQQQCSTQHRCYLRHAPVCNMLELGREPHDFLQSPIRKCIGPPAAVKFSLAFAASRAVTAAMVLMKAPRRGLRRILCSIMLEYHLAGRVFKAPC